MKKEQIELRINKKESFVETWYEGSVMYDGEQHMFWLVDPDRSDYEPEVRWFFQNVPREVRQMYSVIIDNFKEIKNDRRTENGSAV
jgi:hypothetical protein